MMAFKSYLNTATDGRPGPFQISLAASWIGGAKERKKNGLISETTNILFSSFHDINLTILSTLDSHGLLEKSAD